MSAATRYVESVVDHYGVDGALARTRRMTHDRAYRHKPQWLSEAIAILERMAAAQQETEQ